MLRLVRGAGDGDYPENVPGRDEAAQAGEKIQLLELKYVSSDVGCMMVKGCNACTVTA